MIYGVSRLPRYSIVTENHVSILSQSEDGDFIYTSDEEPNGGAFRPCPEDAKNGVDTPKLLQQAVGYVADYAKWEERGTCKSILRKDLGFWFRDSRNNFTYRRIHAGTAQQISAVR
jgi:hypothetical protein